MTDKTISGAEFQSECQGATKTLARNHTAQVVFQGTRAMTDKQNIILPSLPDDAELTTHQARVARGFVDHETDHQRYTDMDVMKFAKKVAKNADDHRLPGLLNAIEDVRIEARGIKEYPGSRQNLETCMDSVAKHFLEEVLPEEEGDPMSDRDAIMGVAMTWAGRKKLGYKGESIDAALDKLDPKIRTEAEAWADSIIKAETTWDSLKIAKAVALKKEPGEEDDEDVEKYGESDGSGGEGEGGGEEAKAPNRGTVNGEMPSGSKPMLEEQSGQALDGVLASALKNDGTGYRAFTTAEDKVHYWRDRKNKYDYIDKEDRCSASNYGYSILARGLKWGLDRYESDKRDISAHVNVMKARLQRCLMDMAKREWDVGKEDGYLDSKRLVAASTGVSNVYRIRDDAPELDTAVEILIDLSASMMGNPARLAQQTTIALAESLNGSGIPFEVTGFNDHSEWLTKSARDAWESEPDQDKWGRAFPIDHWVFKGFGDSLREAKGSIGNIVRSVDGSNVDGEGVMWAAKRLDERPENKKVLFVLSDGFPAFWSPRARSYHGTRLAHDHLRWVVQYWENKPNYHVIGVGMASEAVSQFYKINSVVQNIEELPGVMMGHLGKVLLGERVRIDSKELLKVSRRRF